MNKKIFFIILATIFVGSGTWFFAGTQKSESIFTENQISNFASPLPASPNAEASQAVSEHKENKNEVTLKAGDKTYVTSIAEESSVYDAMTHLSSGGTPLLIFEAENYPSLGYFIKSINGIKNVDGYYWTLYVNGRYSTVGASDYKLSNGDKIDWKYEKNL